MKKLFRNALLLGAAGLFGLTALTGCSNATGDYAKKINDEAQDGDDDYYTYDQVMKDLGDEAIDYTVALLGSHSGLIIAAQGCKTQEELNKKLDEGKEVKGIVVVILANKATGAEYRVITADDVKA